MTQAVLGLLALWIAAAVFWLALYPLFGSRGTIPARDLELQDLEAEKDRLVQEIKDVELDHATGKLSDEDRAALDQRLKAKAVAVMEAIESHRKKKT
jgi:hypothetical protein